MTLKMKFEIKCCKYLIIEKRISGRSRGSGAGGRK